MGFDATSYAAHGRWHTALRLRPTRPIGDHASQPVPTAPAQPKLAVECLSAESSSTHGGRLAPRIGRLSTESGHGQLLYGRDEYVGIPALANSWQLVVRATPVCLTPMTSTAALRNNSNLVVPQDGPVNHVPGRA
jgi:hypothetical protein